MLRSIRLIAVAAVSAYGQRTATTTLQVQVRPEVHLAPQQISLSFRVSPDGSADITRQTEFVAAWVRALPGQRIRLQASALSLSGPAGPVSATALGWSGSLLRASPGAQSAACTNGTFDPGQPLDLIADWTRSASLTCAVTFSLISPASLPPGSYSGVVALSLRSE